MRKDLHQPLAVEAVDPGLHPLQRARRIARQAAQLLLGDPLAGPEHAQHVPLGARDSLLHALSSAASTPIFIVAAGPRNLTLGEKKPYVGCPRGTLGATMLLAAARRPLSFIGDDHAQETGQPTKTGTQDQ